MKKIVFIVPFFGHFNNYFDIWLNSCKNNPTIDWLIFTDCHDIHDYPQNVKIVYIDFDALKERIQTFYDFQISLEKPYKLCDFKPAYGEIFYEYIKEYDFWGFCDTDLIWGNIRKFITDDLLNQYDKIGDRGHCCIIRNSDKMRKAYRYESANYVTYRDAFTSCLAYCFDENKAFGKYCHENGIKTYDNFTFFDIDYRHDDYRVPQYEKSVFELYAHNIFEYKHGHLYLWSKKVGNGELKCTEIFYAHFQKRRMTVNIENEDYNHFLVFKDKFTTPCTVTNDLIMSLDPKSWKRTLYMKILLKKIRAEIFHLDGIKYYKYNY